DSCSKSDMTRFRIALLLAAYVLFGLVVALDVGPAPSCPSRPRIAGAWRQPAVADVDCSRISVRAVRSHPSRKATVGSVAPSHLAPCLTRWRREGWHRPPNPFHHLGIRGPLPPSPMLPGELD